MVECVLLCGGEGRKMWPYSVISAKAALRVAAEPLIRHTVCNLNNIGITDISIYGNGKIASLKHALLGVAGVTFYDSTGKGDAADLAHYISLHEPDQLLVIFGDTWFSKEAFASIAVMVEKGKPAILISQAKGALPPSYGVRVVDEVVTSIIGHPRHEEAYRFSGALLVTRELFTFIENTPDYFLNIPVGGMPHRERDLLYAVHEAALSGAAIMAHVHSGKSVDLDYPFDLLLANQLAALEATTSSLDVRIDESASVSGGVELSPGSIVGPEAVIEAGVILDGPVVVGARSRLYGGAHIGSNVVIGRDCQIGGYCHIEAGTVVEDSCKVKNGTEVMGVLGSGSSIVHHSEFAGITGRSVDIGAGTLSGTLRFDDQKTRHRTEHYQIAPEVGSNLNYLGDFCRTGVGVILYPGVEIGPYSCLGPGVVIAEDVPERTLILVEQTQLKKTWGPEKYNW